MRRVLCLLAIVGLLPVCTSAAAAVPAVHGIGVEERIDQPPVLSTALPSGDAPIVPVVVNLVIDAQQFTGAEAAGAFARLDARIALYRSRKIPVVLVLGALPVSDTDITAAIAVIRSIAQREHGQVAAYEIGA